HSRALVGRVEADGVVPARLTRFFFFSSRRRHTRSKRDWSSDVCSSDLYATENIIPVSLELGGKSPNIFFGDVLDTNDGFLDKALEGFTFFALNQGEVC